MGRPSKAQVIQRCANHIDVPAGPTFVLNEERQKLVGNVGYRIIAASIHALLSDGGGFAQADLDCAFPDVVPGQRDS